MTNLAAERSAYAVAAVILLSLVAWIAFDYRAQRRALAELESRGVIRRSTGRPA